MSAPRTPRSKPLMSGNARQCLLVTGGGLILLLACTNTTSQPDSPGPLTATVNGRPWSADRAPGDTIGGATQSSLDFGGTRTTASEQQILHFHVGSFVGTGTYALGAVGLGNYAEFHVRVPGEPLQDSDWRTTDPQSGQVTVSFDPATRTLAGTFNLTLSHYLGPGSGVVTVTGGAFSGVIH